MPADTTMDTRENQDESATGGRKSGRLLLWMLLIVLLTGGGAGAAWHFGYLGERSETETVRERAPIYFTLDDNLVVNFQSPGRARYLQVGIELMTREAAAIDVLQRHAPVVRNNLIMLMSEQSFETLASREGKEALQQAALEEVQRVVTEFHGSPAVESLYFTGFLMQ